MSTSVQAYASRTGWIMLAAIVMFSVGVFRVISGISYLANSHKVNDYTAGLFGDNMWAWGLWDLGIATVAIWAAFSLLSGGEFGRARRRLSVHGYRSRRAGLGLRPTDLTAAFVPNAMVMAFWRDACAPSIQRTRRLPARRR